MRADFSVTICRNATGAIDAVGAAQVSRVSLERRTDDLWELILEAADGPQWVFALRAHGLGWEGLLAVHVAEPLAEQE